ncbi:hypothetical protein COEREDRAFT_9688 [Coemansia reversa NRRL 1564]|uniref:Uncharacterized protein n=1 Tax=Coemansia reversa (strain ATCC 12441 / NRRL 1564) TaxID=763665 RepID=A0A2G5B7S9_COERN|nr:hypothetical protein COEREDRAFT_9688 [Coemansia reversa NRRL 1564]|eukprot:PIA15055.1 hypothetical protein COEREDRAFT_9688 [Coemansia reversa NRRL 1564]
MEQGKEQQQQIRIVVEPCKGMDTELALSKADEDRLVAAASEMLSLTSSRKYMRQAVVPL